MPDFPHVKFPSTFIKKWKKPENSFILSIRESQATQNSRTQTEENVFLGDNN